MKKFMGLAVGTAKGLDSIEQALSTARSMHKAEEQRANLMMALLTAGMIQRSLVVHFNTKETKMTLPLKILESVAKRTDWALNIQRDEKNEVVVVSIVQRPVKAVTSAAEEKPNEPA